MRSMESLSTLPWLLPALLLVGAAALVLRRRWRASLQTQVVADGTRRALAQMSWQEVEELVGEYFRRREFSVTESRQAGPDGASTWSSPSAASTTWCSASTGAPPTSMSTPFAS